MILSLCLAKLPRNRNTCALAPLRLCVAATAFFPVLRSHGPQPRLLPGKGSLDFMFLRDEYTRTTKGDLPPSHPRACWGSRQSAENGISGAVPAIGDEPGRSTLPVASDALAGVQDIALFLAFLA